MSRDLQILLQLPLQKLRDHVVSMEGARRNNDHVTFLSNVHAVSKVLVALSESFDDQYRDQYGDMSAARDAALHDGRVAVHMAAQLCDRIHANDQDDQVEKIVVQELREAGYEPSNYGWMGEGEGQ